MFFGEHTIHHNENEKRQKKWKTAKDEAKNISRKNKRRNMKKNKIKQNELEPKNEKK